MLSIAYPGAMQYYYKTIREIPAGWGFAVVIFIPKKAGAYLPELPAVCWGIKIKCKTARSGGN